MSTLEAAGLVLLFLQFPRPVIGQKTLSECKAVYGLVLLDSTKNVKEEGRQLMVSLANLITSSLPDHSVSSIYLVDDKYTKVDNLDGVLNVSPSQSSKITASAVKAAIVDAFPVPYYPTKAEIIFIFTTDTTVIDIPDIILKKKTFVIVVGTSIPSSAIDIASSASHVYLVKPDGEDIVEVVKEIQQQTCKDSYFLCDVDKHKDNYQYSTCVNCLDVCSEKRVREADCPSCPYMRLPPKVQEIKHGPSTDDSYPVTYITDNKNTFIDSAIVSLVVIAVVIGIILSAYACYRRKVACFGRESIEIGGMHQRVPDSIAVLEEGDQNISQGPVDNHEPLLPPSQSPSNLHDEACASGCQGHSGRYVNIRHTESGCGIEETTV
ncbi:uncharacterized protein LOC132752920 isoform X2 [Ruditapes philippinarum]|uniref:uncharacterized protein LOC132752920 isoform X2 n=1 Tax=Ruditapes philippinarum TaxID=129788 RepID=UPI00295C2019|nr:uncharacterized protein LOC132752920 isoform X2 [Ruditapes philippinarum]